MKYPDTHIRDEIKAVKSFDKGVVPTAHGRQKDIGKAAAKSESEKYSSG